MKISGRKPIARTTRTQGPVPGSGPVKADNAVRIEPAADVELSESLAEVNTAKTALAAMPDVRTEKIEAIKPRIEDGSYEVDSKVVAKKMVDSSLRESAEQKLSSKG